MKYNTKDSAIFVFFISFACYLFTIFPDTYFDDTPELVGAAFNLGIAHPSGYPLYVILGKLFSLIPIGSIAFKANLLSAFLSSLGLVVLFVSLEMFFADLILAVISVTIFAFSTTLWSQSVIGEVYPLNNLFISLLFYLSCLYADKRDNRYLLISAFLFGLGMTNHITLILILPFLLAVLYGEGTKLALECCNRGAQRQKGERGKINWKIVLYMFLFFLIGLSVYLYIPLRSMTKAEANWFGTGELTVKRIVDYILISKDQNIIYSEVSNKTFPFLFDKYRLILKNLFKLLCDEFPVPFFLFIPFGISYLFKNKLKVSFCLFILIAPFFFLFLVFCDPERIGPQGAFILPFFLVISVWIGAGIYYVMVLLSGKRGYLLNALPVIVLAVILPFQFYKNDQSSNYLASDYGKNILNTPTPKGNINYYVGTQNMYLLFYLNQYVENYRTDISYGADVIYNPEKDNYLYIPDPVYDKSRYDKIPAGLLYRLVPKGDKDDSDYMSYLYLDDLDEDENYKDVQSIGIRGEYYLFKGEEALLKGDTEKAAAYLDIALKYNPTIFFERGKRALRDGNRDRAKEEFLKVLRYIPSHPEANYNLGLMAYISGDIESATGYLERVGEVNEISVEAYFILGKMYEDKKDIKKALSYWERYLRYKPVSDNAAFVDRRLSILRELKK